MTASYDRKQRVLYVCGLCVQVSVTYDPYMYLSLPLPGKPRHTVSVRFTFLDPAKPPTEVVTIAHRSLSATRC